MRSNPDHAKHRRAQLVASAAPGQTRLRLLMMALFVLATLAALALPANRAHAQSSMKHLEYAAETESLDIFVVSEVDARINARRCDYCDLLTLTVTAQTTILMGGVQVSVHDAERYRNDGATVLFDPETKRVTRILLWHRPASLN